MSKASKTDRERLAKLNDQDIDTSDIPELGEDFFLLAELRVPAMGSRKACIAHNDAIAGKPAPTKDRVRPS
ncbi:hypothetical protein NUH87_14415 [Pseudomonas batumici]|uniref:hypothetical protein n=1 Tax=Pseudomonas batumici TaxID=226910 RepID=UPI0030D4685A